MVDSPFNWLHRLFPRLPVAKRLGLVVTAVTLYCLLVELLIWLCNWTDAKTTWGVETAVLQGLVIGLLLVFRNNEANKRWWEARTQWGQLINEMRNLSLKIRAYVAADVAERRQLAALLTGYAQALVRHLRGEGRLQEVPGFDHDLRQPAHVPYFLAGLVQEQLAAWHRAGKVADMPLLLLDTHARSLMDICGACERIRNTPLPLSYRMLLRHGLWLFLLLTPWYLDPEIGIWSAPVLAVVTYFLFGVELTAEEVEEPFGREPDDLSLEKFCQIIEASVTDVLA